MADVVVPKRLATGALSVVLTLPTVVRSASAFRTTLALPTTRRPNNLIKQNLRPWYGAHQLGGTVYVVGPPSTPTKKQVFLFDDITGLCIDQKWSDPTTGAYLFTNINGSRKYSVASFDPDGVFGAVIADNLTPTPMP